ncbi:MAG: hypothetical protein AAFQ94_21340 [Bacteroidota bacterium]
MKTQNQNNKVVKSILMLLFLSVITFSTSNAIGIDDGKSSKKESTETVESTELINELLESLETEELVFNEVTPQDNIQIFNANDEVLFDGSESEMKNDQKLVVIKRKAEFLFESNGTKIYKVF